MRTLIVTEFITLDGVVDSPGGGDHPRAGWTFKEVDFVEDAYEIKGREQVEAGAMLIGRVSYDEFAPVWPKMEEFAEYNAMPKYVVSTHAQRPRVEQHLGAALARRGREAQGGRRRQHPRHGSPTLAQALGEAGSSTATTCSPRRSLVAGFRRPGTFVRVIRLPCCMTTIGIIGAGHIGSQVARAAIANGYEVVLSNSRGPETLAGLIGELGEHARAATAADAASVGRCRRGDGAVQGVCVDPGRAARREDRHRHEQLLLGARRPRARARRGPRHRHRHAAGAPARSRVAKGFNHITARDITTDGKPPGRPTVAPSRPRATSTTPHDSSPSCTTSSASTPSTSGRSPRAGASSATSPRTWFRRRATSSWRTSPRPSGRPPPRKPYPAPT